MHKIQNADKWRRDLRSQIAENSISMAEIGRNLGITRARVYQILCQNGSRLTAENILRIQGAIERVLRERYAALGAALDPRATGQRVQQAEIAAARIALEEAAAQGTTPWEALKAEIGL